MSSPLVGTDFVGTISLENNDGEPYPIDPLTMDSVPVNVVGLSRSVVGISSARRELRGWFSAGEAGRGDHGGHGARYHGPKWCTDFGDRYTRKRYEEGQDGGFSTEFVFCRVGEVGADGGQQR
jgi:hypothetical protein